MSIESDWRARQRRGLDKQIDHLRLKWTQAHYEAPTIGEQEDYLDWLVIVPGMELPKGWNATICTVLMPMRLLDDHAQPLNGFFVDLDLRLADGRHPHYSRPDDTTKPGHWIAGHPQWRGVTRFWWKAQMRDPRYDTLFTAAMVARQRLQRVM